MDNNPINNDLYDTNDNPDVIDNLYQYDHNQHYDIRIAEQNPNEYQEMFFDFDAFLRENVDVNTTNNNENNNNDISEITTIKQGEL
jgi:hypothetical protein